MRPLRLVERDHWIAAVSRLDSPVSSPMTVAFETLPWHWDLMDRIASAPAGENRLCGGDFEDLGTMLHCGWRRSDHTPTGVYAEADLTSSAARSGRYGLRLAVSAASEDHSQVLLETPPIWITSPVVPVEAGELVAIHGWVNVPIQVTGSADGLMIVDSLSGESLAERISQTSGWQEFTLYRISHQQGGVTLTFALSGFGEAWLDEVTVKPIPLGNVKTVARDWGVGPRPQSPPELRY